MTIQQLCRENQIYKLKVIQLTKERQMLECDYNARLKADMVAILEVIKLRIDNLPEPLNRDRVNYCIQQKINELPSVTPQEPRKGHCKDCKWWKDSDGEYRRGCGAESQCPINRREVYEGNGYCYMFEPQESEET